MVPAGKIWNLTLPPVSASACLEKPCGELLEMDAARP